MTILNLSLGVLGGACAVLGILAAVEVLPGFIEGSELIGTNLTTTAFFWGLAALLFLAGIIVSINRGYGSYD